MIGSTMTVSASEQGYALPARVLHWVTAVIVIGMIPSASIWPMRAPDLHDQSLGLSAIASRTRNRCRSKLRRSSLPGSSTALPATWMSHAASQWP